MSDNIRTIRILDTTLRDGEQAPGFSMNPHEKLEVAKALERLGVDIIEAGFPASSPGDLESVRTISALIKDSTVAGLCRAIEGDIDLAWTALAQAADPLIHIFLATSPIHLKYKLKMTEDEVVRQASSTVKYARRLCPRVLFSAEDGSRSDPAFLCRVFGAAIDAGAETVNIADTVGYALPGELAALVRRVKGSIGQVRLSVHCHNDLGLAVANTLAALSAGADQADCAVNGLGERAGNASLEELVMLLRTRREELGMDTRVDSTMIYSASRLVSKVTGIKVQPNKAIVGDNAFAHEAGIHQHGVIEHRSTYEIMSAEDIGIPIDRMVLGKHSGKHAFEQRLKELGLYLDPGKLETCFAQFKLLADKKKTVGDRDIEALVIDLASAAPEVWKLDHWAVNTSSALGATGTIRLLHKDGEFQKRVSEGTGPIDAIFKAINAIIGREPELELYEIGAITGGSASQGETMVKISLGGRHWNGRGVSTDVLESSIRAYLAAINAMEWDVIGGRSQHT